MVAPTYKYKTWVYSQKTQLLSYNLHCTCKTY